MPSNIKDTAISVFWALGCSQPPVFISGAPRSGTTWMMEVLTRISGSRVLWEPVNWFLYTQFYDRSSDIAGWMRADTDCLTRDKEIRDEFLRILSGGMPRRALMTRISGMSEVANLVRILSAQQTLIKFVFSQRALPWMATNTTNAGAVILRHPVAIAASQLHHPYKAGGGDGKHPEWTECVLRATHPMWTETDRDRWPALKMFENRDLSVVERLTVTACLDLLHALEATAVREKYTFVVYETLRDNPAAFLALAKALGLKIREKPSLELLQRRSRTSSAQKNTNEFPKERMRLNVEDLAAGQAIVEAMGLGAFGPDGRINVDALKARGFCTLIH